MAKKVLRAAKHARKHANVSINNPDKKSGKGKIAGKKAKDIRSIGGRLTDRQKVVSEGETSVPIAQKQETKTSRYEIRFTEQQVEIMERASDILGYKSAPEYIRHVMHENASRVIKDQAILQIAEQDRKRFMDEIINPSEPSEAFKKGRALFNKSFKGE